MSAIEQKIISLFNPLPLSVKARIVAALSQLLANEATDSETHFLEEDLATSNEVRKMISEGEMKLLTEEEYWSKLKSS